MKALVGLIVLLLTTSAFAQTAPPKQAKPQGPVGCKLVGTVKGTKLWAGDCMDAAALIGAENPQPKPASHRYLRKPDPQFHPVKHDSLAKPSRAAFALG